MKGETAQELIGFARVMREKAEPLWEAKFYPSSTPRHRRRRSGTFNISTAAAFVRGCRRTSCEAREPIGKQPLRKRGRDGGARHRIQMPIERLRTAITEVGIGFLFAQRFHTSMKHVMPQDAVESSNRLQHSRPLASPAAACFHVVGVSSPEIMESDGERASRSWVEARDLSCTARMGWTKCRFQAVLMSSKSVVRNPAICDDA
jgi:anthranilate phosphoribosyltransferase